jgi:DNA-binding XRE family transcriptional regulator
MSKKPLDFAKVDALRKHMMLRHADMAEIFGVSRVTYNSWIKGTYPRVKKDAEVRVALNKLINIMTKYDWPQANVIVMSANERKETLFALLENAQ